MHELSAKPPLTNLLTYLLIVQRGFHWAVLAAVVNHSVEDSMFVVLVFVHLYRRAGMAGISTGQFYESVFRQL